MMKTKKGRAHLHLQLKELKEKEELQLTLLKAHFSGLLDSLSPSSLLKSSLTGLASSNNFKQNVIDSSVSAGAGLLARRLFTGGSKNVFKKLAGFLLQDITTVLVSKKMPAIREKITQFRTT